MKILVLIAQVYLGAYFLYNAYNHFANRAAVAGYAKMRGVPAPQLLWVIVTGVVHLGAGLSLLLGYQVILGAWLAIIFLVLAAFLVHHFWTDQGMERLGQQVHFGKNLAMAAALFLVTLVPADAWVISIGR
jgi:putative oxidoreductase